MCDCLFVVCVHVFLFSFADRRLFRVASQRLSTPCFFRASGRPRTHFFLPSFMFSISRIPVAQTEVTRRTFLFSLFF